MSEFVLCPMIVLLLSIVRRIGLGWAQKFSYSYSYFFSDCHFRLLGYCEVVVMDYCA